MKRYYIDGMNQEVMNHYSLNLLFSEFVIVEQGNDNEEDNIKCTYYDTNKFRSFVFYKQITRSISEFSNMSIYE